MNPVQRYRAGLCHLSWRLGNDSAGGIALDSNGDIYVTGQTNSSDFPTTVWCLPVVAGRHAECLHDRIEFQRQRHCLFHLSGQRLRGPLPKAPRGSGGCGRLCASYAEGVQLVHRPLMNRASGHLWVICITEASSVML